MAVMWVIRGGCGHQQTVVRVGQCMARAADDALGGIVPAHALEPDTARAHGMCIKDSPRRTGLTPTRSRSARVRACGIRSNTPASPQRWNQRYTVPQGGKWSNSWYAGQKGTIEHGALRPQPRAACSAWGGQQLPEQGPINVA